MIAPVLLLAVAALAAAKPAPPARVQAVATEFELALSRQSVKTGRVIVQLVNFGEDPHDLVIRRIATRANTFRIAETPPGEHRDINLRLGPGRYRLWCSIADHRARGMYALLTVRK